MSKLFVLSSLICFVAICGCEPESQSGKQKSTKVNAPSSNTESKTRSDESEILKKQIADLELALQKTEQEKVAMQKSIDAQEAKLASIRTVIEGEKQKLQSSLEVLDAIIGEELQPDAKGNHQHIGEAEGHTEQTTDEKIAGHDESGDDESGDDESGDDESGDDDAGDGEGDGEGELDDAGHHDSAVDKTDSANNSQEPPKRLGPKLPPENE